MNRRGPRPAATCAWFDLARAGNFPSVASNVLAALALSGAAGATWPAAGVLGWSILAGVLAYAGGATLNDVADAAFDAVHRPERAIPRGAVTRAAAGWIGAIELAAGAGALIAGGAAGGWVAGLVATILVYDGIHKRWLGAVGLMAGCRVLLACALASRPGQAFTPALWGWLAALFVYITALSVIARWEYRPGAPAARLGRAVGRLLAFIPLVDAIALLAAGAWQPALACAAAIPLGRWMQKVAAST